MDTGLRLSRRVLFAGVLCRPANRSTPTDADTINSFVREFNKYIESYNSGVVDLKEWQRVEKKWEDMR